MSYSRIVNGILVDGLAILVHDSQMTDGYNSSPAQTCIDCQQHLAGRDTYWQCFWCNQAVCERCASLEPVGLTSIAPFCHTCLIQYQDGAATVESTKAKEMRMMIMVSAVAGQHTLGRWQLFTGRGDRRGSRAICTGCEGRVTIWHDTGDTLTNLAETCPLALT